MEQDDLSVASTDTDLVCSYRLDALDALGADILGED